MVLSSKLRACRGIYYEYRPMSTQLQDTNLFRPIVVGHNAQLNHRVVHLPTSRSRSTNDGENFPTDLMLEYYDSRSKVSGSLIIFESCLVSPRSGLSPYKSGVWSRPQCKALKLITDKIHANGSYVSCQIFAPGRTSNIALLKEKGLPLLAPTSIYHSSDQAKAAKDLNYPLQELTVEQIHNMQQDFVTAAVNCLPIAGFDMVELHGSSGFLIEQFLSPISNLRTDEYGGSVENRCRFLKEIIEMFIRHPEIGSAKFGVRLSAWSTHFGMEYPEDEYSMDETFPPFLYCAHMMSFLEKCRLSGEEVAYVSIQEPRVSGSVDQNPSGRSNAALLSIWSGIVIRAGGYATDYKGDPSRIASNNPNLEITDGQIKHYSSLIKDVNADERTLIGFSRPFTSNPDLIERLRSNKKLDLYHREHFYTHKVEGYLTFRDYVDDHLFSNTLALSQEALDKHGVSLAAHDD
ncbi:hypothetical protein KGF57_003910 [Candida theae]|uniref:NADH:flavin oxidoreductase/NADH oxidase N-terminal domain-containing protein n=1 Tax=Candida theae TaxID=1198502 RepID=A0AAD5FXL4_9ASCO|nr:uncharacterized protein KGF57_003910 [Candida theae]KAI5954884.1 hypothetical protein KGF57_003910 [Candida theae]